MLRQLALTDMGAAAQVHRAAFDHAMPWLVGLHTPDQDRWFYREHVFATCRVYVSRANHVPPLNRCHCGVMLLR